ncbi:glycosyltransferase [Clostridium chrysemydis]|uniref:glycosyltransferase n=1 Tax=Clostridium chrysemydis TaxID=2665504 RepID=UPI003F34218B
MCKINVLLMTDQLRVGGGEKYFLKIENSIDDKNVKLYTAAEDGECRDMLRDKEHFTFLPKGKIKRIKTVKQIIESNEIDLIHANSFKISFTSNIAKIFSKRKPKIIYTKHNLTILEQIGDWAFSFYINRCIDKLLTVCDSDKEKMIKKGVNKNKVLSIPNGTDINEFIFTPSYINEKNESLKIGILARLDRVKNHNLFIDIINEFNDENEIKVNGFIAGDGELKNDIQMKIKESNSNVKMLGNFDKPYNFLKNIDVLMLTSEREVFPMTILEALSVGVIVIAPDVGGISDVIVNNKTGYLIKNHSKDEYKKAILNIQNLRDSNVNIINNGRKKIEKRYSNTKMMKSLEKIYKEK